MAYDGFDPLNIGNGYVNVFLFTIGLYGNKEIILYLMEHYGTYTQCCLVHAN